MINSAVRKTNKPCWFVMRCHEAEKMEALIESYNADKDVLPDNKIEDYFIPSLVVRQRIGLVFLYVRPSAFDPRADNKSIYHWNAGRRRITFYNDAQGEAVTVRPEMMHLFIQGCLEYLERFELHPRDAEIADGIEVTVCRGTFKDYKAEVYNVHYKADGIRFSIAIRFFANDQYIHIHDLSPEDVKLDTQEMSIFSDDFIDRLQSILLEILRRKVNRKETAETRAADAKQLRKLYYLRHAAIDDPLRAAKFDALMSICASLSGQAQEKTKYNKIVKQRLKELDSRQESQENFVARAYLLTALYLSTKDADYRTELKTIVMGRLPDYKALREFLSLVRK